MAEPPGLARRLAAIVYDTLILTAVMIPATALWLPFTKAAIEPATRWFQLYLASILLSYFVGFWWRRGQTIGMVAWRFRVVADDGAAVTLMQAALRALTAPFSWVALGAGFLWSLADRHRRGWHDLLSNTRLERC